MADRWGQQPKGYCSFNQKLLATNIKKLHRSLKINEAGSEVHVVMQLCAGQKNLTTHVEPG